jgi:hypothetical protein
MIGVLGLSIDKWIGHYYIRVYIDVRKYSCFLLSCCCLNRFDNERTRSIQVTIVDTTGQKHPRQRETDRHVYSIDSKSIRLVFIDNVQYRSI